MCLDITSLHLSRGNLTLRPSQIPGQKVSTRPTHDMVPIVPRHVLDELTLGIETMSFIFDVGPQITYRF